MLAADMNLCQPPELFGMFKAITSPWCQWVQITGRSKDAES